MAGAELFDAASGEPPIPGSPGTSAEQAVAGGGSAVVEIPDTLAASITNASKHLVGLLDGSGEMPEDATESLQAFMQLLQALAQRDQAANQTEPTGPPPGGTPPGALQPA